MAVIEVKHPLVKHKIGLMREAEISTKKFRELTGEIARLLAYEATADFVTEKVTIECWSGPTEVDQIAGKKVTVVPILRAGLGMVDQAHALIPEAQVGFVGIARDETTTLPTPYLESLPDDLSAKPVLVLDPMLATGGSMAHTLGLLKARRAVDITAVCVVCAPQGIAALERVVPDLKLVTAAVDAGLNEHAYIVPGLGDAGDRQFGPR